MGFSIRRYKESDMLACVSLARSSKRISIPDGFEKVWEWKYRLSNAEKEPPIWVLEDAGTVVGMVPSIPARIHADGQEHELLWGTDIFRDESRSDLGVAMLGLMRKWQKDRDIAMGMGVSEDGYAVQKRMGFVDVRFPRIWVKIIRPVPVLRSVAGMVGSILGFLSVPLIRGFNRIRERSGPTAAIVDAVDQRFNDIWDSAKDALGASVARTSDRLRWRFDEHPLFTYTRVLIEDRAYAIGRMGKHHSLAGASIGFISDIISRDDAAAFGCLAALENIFRKDGADILVAISSSSVTDKYLRGRGFLPTPRKLPLIAYSENQDLMEILQGSGMYTTLSDSDGDML